MKTVCVATRKGGSGKTTLARNLAVAAANDGWRVLMLDLDPVQGLREWWQGRDKDTPMMLDADPPPHMLGKTLDAVRDRFDLVVIDTPPSVQPWFQGVLGVIDLALVPVRPSPDDLRAVVTTVCDLKAAQVPFVFVISQADQVQAKQEVTDFLILLGRIAPIRICARAAHVETAATGEGVTESDDTAAATEIADLWAHVRGLLA